MIGTTGSSSAIILLRTGATSSGHNAVLRARQVTAGLPPSRPVAAGREHLICDAQQVAQGQSGQARWSRPAGRRALRAVPRLLRDET